MTSRIFPFALFAVTSLAAIAACDKPSSQAQASPAPAGSNAPKGRVIAVEATTEGYKPSTLEAKKGEDLVIRFTRTTKSECLAEIMFPEQKIKQALPMNTPVDIAIKADKEGKIPFQCGMAMVKGVINVTGG